jgi:hypothetical protein
MNHTTIMETGEYFALCNNCKKITHYGPDKCIVCQSPIDKDKYKQCSSVRKYKFLLKMLTTLEINIIDNCYSMISIYVRGNKSFTPELYQIYKINDEYKYAHLEEGTHKILEEQIIDPESFVLSLDITRKYNIDLSYGPHIIFVHQ